MSTQRLLPRMRKGMGWSVVSPLSLLVGVLLLLQLALPSVALAFHTSPTPTPVPTSSPTPPTGASSTPQTVPQDGAQVLAEVSVVRLVATYTGASDQGPKPSLISCTGLGIIIGSWPVSSSSLTTTTWVLTDASVVNTAKAGCAAAAKLGSIQVYANSFYTGSLSASTLPNSALLGTRTCTTVCSVMQLATSSACLTQCAGPVVFSFTTSQPQPFISPAQNDLTPHLGLALTDNQQQSPPVTKNVQVQNYLTPTVVSPSILSGTGTSGTSTQPELGLPLINREGQLVNMHLSSGSLDLTKLSTFITTQTGSASHSNALNTAWLQGISFFYGLNGQSKDLNAAAAEFQQAHTANPDFQAATFMQQAAVNAAGSSQRTSPPTTPSSSTSSKFFGIPLWLLAIIALVVLLAIFVLVSLSFGRKRAQQRQELARFKADQAEAQRMAEIEVQRQREASAPGNRSNPSNQQAQIVSDLHCPNCNYSVSTNDAYCPNCHTLLSPSASGPHVLSQQPAPPLQPAQAAPDAIWPGNYPPPPQISPQQADFAQQPSSLVPASSISDQPTIEMSPDTPKNGQFDAEKTVPYAVQQLRGRNLSLAVGYRTDPGIKRKHKPNEDSLFAMQGARRHNSQPEEFGLFVVADGMGGHANGQDASRLAIQTIIDYILPKITASNNLDDASFLKLLSDGVQCANEAVHQRNMEEHADMGTTMTAALVVGSTSYIANVGDSRTYLYREPEGLQKITRDHSVVASLVDAGIIQPDDIYTHPKRNQIYRSLGEKPVVEVDSFRIPLQAGDKILLCSDGLWDMVRDPEIQRLMSNPVPDPNIAGNALIQAALDSGGEDNVSVIVVYITETSNHTGITGIQLLAKPDSVTVPEIQSL